MALAKTDVVMEKTATGTRYLATYFDPCSACGKRMLDGRRFSDLRSAARWISADHVCPRCVRKPARDVATAA